MPERRPAALLLTCEHGGHSVPAAYRHLFRDHAPLLATHRGWDIGALAVAQVLAGRLHVPLMAATVSRLVVELNRSPHHPQLYSAITKALPAAERKDLLARHYYPYRHAVEAWIAQRLQRVRQVLHLSIHSFTPKLGGEVRACELGLLYDPRRSGELRFARDFLAALGPPAADNGLRLRRNYPYLGKADGFMTHLRRTFAASRYVGVEIEMNQALTRTPAGRRLMAAVLGQALAASGYGGDQLGRQ